MSNERPGLREQLITALSMSNLAGAEGRECALDRVAAFGAAQISPTFPTHAAQRELAAESDTDARRIGGVNAYASVALDVSIDAPPIDEHPVYAGRALFHEYISGSSTLLIEPRLAAILLRVKYLHEASLVAESVELFARILRRRNRRKADAELLVPIARQAIAEWISGSCPDCHGIGRRGATLGGVDERLVTCRTCERVDGKPSGFVRTVLPGVGPARIGCPACCGRLTVTQRKRVRGRGGDVCGRCSGAGHFVASDVDRANAIGVKLEQRRRDPQSKEREDELQRLRGRGKLPRRWAVLFDTALRSVRALDRRLLSSFGDQLGRAAI